jgi:hypothetical protein
MTIQFRDNKERKSMRHNICSIYTGSILYAINFNIKISFFHVHRGTSCENTAPTDKICGNESKIRMTSQNYRFLQCIFPIFQFLRPKRNGPGKELNYFFAIFGFNVLKCNVLSKLLSVILGPLVMVIMQ